MMPRLAVSSALAAMLAVLGLPAVNASAHADSAVHVWITTPDGAQKLSRANDAAFQKGAGSFETLTVDPSRTFQTMTGFGGSLTDSSASLLYGLPPSARDALMRELFDPSTGDGLNFLRQPIGASDFVTQDYTFDDMPAGPDRLPAAALLDRARQAQILPLLRQAERLNPALTVMATPWSPPAWMKTERLARRRPAHRQTRRSTSRTRSTWSSSRRRTRPTGVPVDT